MTTDALTPGLPAAIRRGALRIAFAALLGLASLPLAAAPPQATPTDPTPPPHTALAARLDALAAAPAVAGVSAPAATMASPEATEPQPASLNERIQSILANAVTLLGTPYRWGGATPQSGFDCSGLVGYVFRTTLGIELPRVSRDMAGRGEAVQQRNALVPGDLVFFNLRGRIDHVGIYLGDGRFLHAPRTGRDVRVDSLDSGYWRGRYVQGRRVAL